MRRHGSKLASMKMASKKILGVMTGNGDLLGMNAISLATLGSDVVLRYLPPA
jgi:hypothetical protein